MSTTATKWTSEAGPRQTKLVNDAISRFGSRARTHKEITDHGEHCYMVFGGGTNPQAAPLMDEVRERFGGLITRTNYKDVIAAIDEAAGRIEIPVIDKRSTPEERAERERIMAEQRAKDEARTKALKESREAILAKKPAWANALIVAEEVEDKSDSMSDYFGHETKRRVAIGWRRSTREDFREMRAAAATFPETAHMGPGKDVWRVASIDPECYGRYLDLDGRPGVGGGMNQDQARFETEDEAKAFIAKHGLEGKAEASMESFEHRENYSGGSGYYLGEWKHRSGWKVRAYSLKYDLAYVFEDHLPEPGAAPVRAAVESDGAGSGTGSAHVEKHYHTKRGCDIWIVVLDSKVDDGTFNRLRSEAKSLGGWYSRKWGRTPGGFAFETQDAAEQFSATI